MENKLTTEQEVEIISKGLDAALEYGLEVEVIYQALQAMKKAFIASEKSKSIQLLENDTDA